MTKQPEALRLADVLIGSPQFTGTTIWQAADMLRTQHALIEDLKKALREVPDTQLQYADHIRRQHEAIKKLREALTECLDDSKQAVSEYVLNYGENWRPQRLAAMRKTVDDAEQALKDTDELK